MLAKNHMPRISAVQDYPNTIKLLAGCWLLASWLHTGNLVTDYLVIESRLIILPILWNPMMCLFFFVSRPHTWESDLSDLQLCVFGVMWLVVCVWWHVVGGLVVYGLVPWVWVGFDRNTDTQASTHPEKCCVRACFGRMCVG